MPTPEPGERWGILGGTFDPVHRGHITLAHDICRKKHLNGVFLVPAYKHPFKSVQATASFDDRVRMLRLAASAHDCLVVSEIEKTEHLSGYTLDTVRAIKARHPNVTFFFLVGADNISQIDCWHKPEEIFSEIQIIAGTRPPFAPEENVPTRNIEYVETGSVDISSSAIRAAIAGGEELSKLDLWLDPKVRNYIEEKGLYR